MSHPFSAQHRNDQIQPQERNIVIPLDTFYHFVALFGGENSPGGTALIHLASSCGYTPELRRIREAEQKLNIDLNKTTTSR